MIWPEDAATQLKIDTDEPLTPGKKQARDYAYLHALSSIAALARPSFYTI